MSDREIEIQMLRYKHLKIRLEIGGMDEWVFIYELRQICQRLRIPTSQVFQSSQNITTDDRPQYECLQCDFKATSPHAINGHKSRTKHTYRRNEP